MITVLTAWQESDDYPTATDVNIMEDGSLVVTEPSSSSGEDGPDVVAIYAPGAWHRVEKDSSSTLLTSFLEERQLTEAWLSHCDGV